MIRSLSLARLLIPAEAICLTCLVGAIAQHRRHKRVEVPVADGEGEGARRMTARTLGAGSGAVDASPRALQRLGTAISVIEAVGSNEIIGIEGRLASHDVRHIVLNDSEDEEGETVGISGSGSSGSIEEFDYSTYMEEQYRWQMAAVREYNDDLRSRLEHEFGSAFAPDSSAGFGTGTLRGRAVEFASGEPIIGARVAFVANGRRVETVTNTDGAFALAGVGPGAAGRLLVRADAKLYVEDTRDLKIEARVATGGVAPVAAADGKGEETALPPIRLVRLDSRPTSARAGVGLAAVNRDGRAVVAYVAPGSSASAAKIRAGDWLLAIDGHDAADLGTSGLAVLLRGLPSSGVDLTLAPAAGGEARTVRLTRGVPAS